MHDAFIRIFANILGRCLLLCCALLGGPVAGAREALPAVDGKWKVFQSPHFELYSRVADRTSLELLRKLELVHAFYRESVPLREREVRPVTVYCFSRSKDLRAYVEAGSNSDMVGYFMTYPDRGVIALSADQGSDISLQVIRMQYVTHLCGLSGPEVPLWFRWGMGFLFGTLENRGDKVAFGAPDPFRDDSVRKKRGFSSAWLLGFANVSSKQSDLDAFHADAWLFLHYLFIGQKDIPRERVIRFLQAVCDESIAEDAAELQRRQPTYEALLGVSFEELDRQVEHYRRRGRFETQYLPSPEITPADRFSVRPVSQEEIGLRLAELDLRNRRSGQAQLLLLTAAGATPPSARALEVLGAVELSNGNYTAARDRWRQAIEAGSDNPAIYHQLGLLETQQLLSQFDLHFRLPAARAEQLRALLTRSIAQSPGQSYSYEALAWVEAFSPQPAAKNINLIQSVFPELDNRSRTLAALAFARFRLGDRAGAEEMLDLIEHSDRRSDIQALVGELRAHMKRLQ